MLKTELNSQFTVKVLPVLSTGIMENANIRYHIFSQWPSLHSPGKKEIIFFLTSRHKIKRDYTIKSTLVICNGMVAHLPQETRHPKPLPGCGVGDPSCAKLIWTKGACLYTFDLSYTEGNGINNNRQMDSQTYKYLTILHIFTNKMINSLSLETT